MPSPLPTRAWRLPPLLTLLAALGLALQPPPAHAQPQPQPQTSPGPILPGRMVSVFVVLEDEPIASVVAARRGNRSLAGTAELARTHARTLQARQAQLETRLETAGAIVSTRLTRIANALRVRIPEDRLPELATLPGVRAIHRVRTHTRHLSSVTPFIGAPRLWNPAPGVPGVDGRGIRIGIIDSGIDYLHADFGGRGQPGDHAANDPTRIEPGSFPTSKVTAGFDFAGDAYDAADERNEIPRPDPDPLDCPGNGHGTHVAGIAAGFGVLDDGRTFTGDLADLTDFTGFKVAPGIAPAAELVALKVFGCEGSTALVTEALEWAADPNGDQDLSDRLDVVNLSLGSEFGSVDPEDTEVAAVNRLASLGTVVVCSAGNGDNIFYALASPGVASRAITVANSLTHGESAALEVTAPDTLAGLHPMVEGALTPPLSTTGPVTGRLVRIDPPPACDAPSNPAELNGNIALIDRGTCLFSVKILHAQAAGALAVVMVNNTGENPIAMGGEGAGIRIPGVMISRADGDRLKAALDTGTPITLRLDSTASVDRPELIDTLDDTSSRGPGSPGNLLKPDLTAPGNGVVSAKAGTGTEGVALSGTSMSAPVVAGAAALLRQRHPNWSAETVKASLMNTSKSLVDPTGQAYPESRTGAGRIRVHLAAASPVTLAAEADDGRVGLSFGSLVLAAPHRETRRVRLSNTSADAVSYHVTFIPTLSQDGVGFQPGAPLVTVPAGGSISLPLELSADPSRFLDQPDPTTLPRIGAGTPLPRHFLYEASGLLTFTPVAETNASPIAPPTPPILHLPCYVNVRAAADYRSATRQILLPGTVSTQTTPDFTLRFLGSQPSTRLHPLVSAFQLGDTSPDKHLTEPNRAAADLLAVGAATDLPTAANFADASVFFGLATAGPFTSPQPHFARFIVFIDTNADTREDYAVLNGNGASTNSGGARDAFMSVVYRLDASGRITSTNAVAFLNHHPADEAETAPFNNSVLVLPVPLTNLGLSTANPAFHYQVLTDTTSGSVDRTGWIPFNPARPILDPARHSPDGSPLHPDGQPLTVRLDREAAHRAGVRIPRLLLLHHFGLPGHRAEVLPIDLALEDTDTDALPDWWEQQHFQTLTRAGTGSDADDDGAPDTHEFLTGTDPADPAASFQVRSASRVSARNIAIRWSGAAGHTYTLERATRLAPANWSVIRTGIEATPPLNTLTDTDAPGNGPYFYRVQMERTP